MSLVLMGEPKDVTPVRFISYALLAGGLLAISAGFYFQSSDGGKTDTALASAENATATAVATRAATATATVAPLVSPPASSLDATPEATLEPTLEAAAVASVPEASDLPPEQSQTLQAVAPPPVPTRAVPAPAATTTPQPPVSLQAPPPPTATPVPPEPPAAPVALGALEQQMFAAHNVERANNGVGPLQIDGTLTQLARIRAQDMASKNYFAHTSPTGQTAFSLLTSSGYVYTLAGENLARNNYPESQSVSVAMSGFMASQAHRINVLEPKFSRVGIGMAVGADGMLYFAVIFAAK